MKKTAKILIGTALGLVGLILLCIIVFVCIYFTRFRTIASIEKESGYTDGYDLYRMDIEYNYDLDAIIDYGLDTDQRFFDAVIQEALPLLPVSIKAPSFGCTAFQLCTDDAAVLMGRNYDFKNNTSAMLVYCAPKDGYRSVAFAALDNISANDPQAGITKKLATLVAPFVCLDGMNEKGVSIAVLVVDSDPVDQSTGKEKLCTTIAIRLVLDRAASTEEAIELLRGYDMRATSGKDYHFYINDASGDGRVVEWDCDSETRELVATPVDVVTNFYTIYEDRVLPNQRNGIYGHGKERYEAVLEVFREQVDHPTLMTAWEALKAAAQEPQGEELTSNTQWSIVYNNTNLTAQIVIRRNWDDVYSYDLTDNALSSYPEMQDASAANNTVQADSAQEAANAILPEQDEDPVDLSALTRDIVTADTLPADPEEYYLTASLPEQDIWVYARHSGQDGLLIWGDCCETLQSPIHAGMRMPQLTMLDGTHLAIIATVDTGAGVSIEQLTVYEMVTEQEGSSTAHRIIAQDFSQLWTNTAAHFNQYNTMTYDRQSNTLSLCYRDTTYTAGPLAEDLGTMLDLEDGFQGAAVVSGDIVRYQVGSDGVITITLPTVIADSGAGSFSADGLWLSEAARYYPMSIGVNGFDLTWAIRFTGSGFETVEYSVRFPGTDSAQ